MDEGGRIGVQQAAQPELEQPNLFDQVEPQWVEVGLKRVRVECARQFGGVWLGYQLLQRLGLIESLAEQLAIGREDIPWATMSMVLVLARWCDPSSELHLAEQGYESMALADLLGVPADKVNHDRLYRTLDRILPHKDALEKHLQQCLGELFQIEYDRCFWESGVPRVKRRSPCLRNSTLSSLVIPRSIPQIRPGLAVFVFDRIPHLLHRGRVMAIAGENLVTQRQTLWLTTRARFTCLQSGRRSREQPCCACGSFSRMGAVERGVEASTRGTGGSFVPGAGRPGSLHSVSQCRARGEGTGYS